MATTNQLDWSQNVGGAGFGMQDYNLYKSQGYTDQQIGNFIRSNQQYFGAGGMNVGPAVRTQLGLGSSYQNTNAGTENDAAATNEGNRSYSQYRQSVANSQQLSDFQRSYSDALAQATAQFQNTQLAQTNAYRTEAELSRAKAERDDALAKAKTWEDQYNRDREYQISDQLRGLRSGSTVGGSGYSVGGGATTGGDGLSVRARGRSDASISEYQRYSSLLGGSSIGGSGSTGAATNVSSLASGTSSASQPSGPSRAALSGYYSRRFG